MQPEQANATFSFIDTSINKSIDFLTDTIRQLFQLISCLLTVLVIGKLINYLMTKKSRIENVCEQLNEQIKIDNNETNDVDKKPELSSDWESEPIPDSLLTQPLEKPKTVTAQAIKKNFRRKCISVGPIMLTPSSQVIRTLDVEEREERYRYTVMAEKTSAEHVCVLFYFINAKIYFCCSRNS